MRILITGADGFIGSHLADFLSGRRAELYGIIHRKPVKNLGQLDKKIKL